MLFIDQSIGDHGHSHGGGAEVDHSGDLKANCTHTEGNGDNHHPNLSNQHVDDKKPKQHGHSHDTTHTNGQGHELKTSSDTSSGNEPLSKSAAVILTIGLSVHNVLEGVSIGLSPTQEKLIVIMIGVCTHKLIDSFFLGMMFMRSNWLDRTGYFIMFLFSLSGPVGVLIGFLLQNGAPLIVQGVMTSLTTGTFLYIAMTEIMPTEFVSQKNKILKICGFIFGFSLFAIFMLFDEHAHEHGGGHENGHGHSHGHSHENDGEGCVQNCIKLLANT